MSSSNLNALLAEGMSISDFFSDLNVSILQAKANFRSIQVQVDSLLHKKAALKAAIDSLPRVTVTLEEELCFFVITKQHHHHKAKAYH
ncbi:hypothetical protein CFP56_040263 [Quercus suber]|uniref:Uncharacterized protein n=1 Tax=Quercus suber TaxID=58331 RepID=A0AAW0IZH7_QUESU